jgi:RecB family exonuclease
VLSAMLPEAILNVKSAFASKFNTQELATGKNLLIVKVAENMVKRFLLTEKKHLEETGDKIEILILEENLESSIQIIDNSSGEILNVKIHGKADRIDKVCGKTRIIDYKTGKVEAKDLKIDQISNLQEKSDPGKLLQVLSYALMFNDMHKNKHMELISGIISLRKTSSYFIKTDINKTESIDKEVLEAFRKELEVIIGSIFNPLEPFGQVENQETCNICSFNTICNRTVN